MLNTEMSPWPIYSEAEIEAVSNILRSGRVNYWTGTEGRKFEREFAEWTGTRHAVALANGTLALDAALRALHIGPGDEVIVTPRTFIASISSVVNAGARPVFADVDRDSGNIEAHTIERVVTPRTRAIIPVHLGGWPCDMGALLDLAASAGSHIIEDCAQAHGAKWQGKSVGSFGAIGAWSFCQDKIISTAGEGGMVTTDDDDLWASMWSIKDHGKTWEAVYEREHPSGYRWVHDRFGTNWRMPEIQATVGRLQLHKLTEWTAARTKTAARYRELAFRFPGALRAPTPPPRDTHAYYRFYIYVRPQGLRDGWDRDRIIAETAARGVTIYQGSCSEVYRERAFDDTDFRPAQRLPVALELAETSLMFLTHPTLTDEDVARTCDAFEAVMRQAAA